MKHIVYIATILMAFVVVGCGGAKSDAETSKTAEQEEAATNPTASWEYFYDTDDLTNKVTGIHAALISNNVQPSTYGGETNLILQISYVPWQGNAVNRVALVFDNEQAKFARYHGGGFFVSFDGKEVDESWKIVGEGGSTALVVTPNIHGDDSLAKSFISKIKDSEKCRIQVNIEGVGMRTFDFNCKGLEWNY